MGLNWTQIIVSLITSLLAGSGLIAIVLKRKFDKKDSLDASIAKTIESAKLLADNLNSLDVRVCDIMNDVASLQAQVKDIQEEIYQIKEKVSALSQISVGESRKISDAVLAIIDGSDLSNERVKTVQRTIWKGLGEVDVYEKTLGEE